MTPEEVASFLKLSKFTIYEMIKREELPASRVGRKIRIRKGDLDLLLRKNTQISDESNLSYQSAPSRQVQGSSSEIYFAGSHDLSMDLLYRHLQIRGITLLPSFAGSLEGLIELFRERTEMAGCHLLDRKKGEYNLPFIPHLVPHEDVTVVRFVHRFQGFIVPKGNPRLITNWQEFLSGRHRIINRQKGSGTRILLDFMLQLHGVRSKDIPGYEREEANHYATAAAVLRGEADAALGIESAARSLGLDFFAVEKEPYDFVIPTRLLNSQRFEILLETLRDSQFQQAVVALGGYDLSQTGHIIATFPL